VEYTSIGEWRIIRAVLRVKIQFQTFVAVTTTTPATIYNTIIQNAAITEQLVAINLGSPAVVQIGTTVDWPYFLYSYDMKVYPANKIQNYTKITSDCVSTQGQLCRQRFTTNLTLTAQTCTLDGTYSLNWTMGCGSDVTAANCPLSKPADFIASIQFGLTSENFCAAITVDVGVVGNIRSYNDSTFDTLPSQTAFIVNRLGYFLVKLNSDLNTPKDSSGNASPDLYQIGGSGTVLTFASVTLYQVTVTPSVGNPVRIFDNGTAVVFAAGTDPSTNCVAISKYSNGTSLPVNEVGFSFNFSRTLASSLTKNGQTSFTVTAEVIGNYANANGKKRGIETSTGADSSSYTTTSTLNDDGTGPTATGTNVVTSTTTVTTHGNNAAALFASLIMTIIALLL